MLAAALAVAAVQAAALGIAYRSVVLHGHTLMAGAYMSGNEGFPATWNYPITPPGSRSTAAGNLFVGRRTNIFDPGGSAWLVEPMVRKAHNQLAHGQLPLWTSNVALGQPLSATAQFGLLDPVNWPILLDTNPRAWDVFFLGRLLLGGLLTTLFCRFVGMRMVSAAVGGLVFELSGQLVTHLNNAEISVEVVLPLMLFGVEMCIRRPSRRASVALGAGVALTLLAGFPEEGALCLTVAGAYGLARLIAVRGGKRWLSTLRAPLLALVAGGALGVLLSAPQWVPFLELLHAGDTIHPGNAQLAGASAQDPRWLPGIVAPHWAGVQSPQWLGAAATVLALLGLRSRALPRGAVLSLAGVAVFFTAVEYDFPDLAVRAVNALPFYRQIFWFRYSGIALTMAGALLAAAGAERFLRNGRRVAWWELMGATAAVGLLMGGGLLSENAGVTATAGGHAVIGVSLALLSLTFVGLVAARYRARWRGPAAVGLFIALTAVFVEGAWSASPLVPFPLRADPLQATPTTAYLSKAMPSGHGRFLGCYGILYPNIPDAYNLDTVQVIDATFPKRYYRYMHLFIDPTMGDRNVLGETPDVPVKVWDNPYLDALSVTAVLSQGQMERDLGGGLPRDPHADYPVQRVNQDGVVVYRNVHATARASVYYAVLPSASEAQTVALLRGIDPRRTVVVEGGGAAPRSGGPPPDTARVLSYDDSNVVIEADARTDGVLVLADVLYPGWDATVDGRATVITPANLALRGIRLTAGHHRVEMHYRPGSFFVGLAGGALAAVLIVAGWLLPLLTERRRRRRPAASPAGGSEEGHRSGGRPDGSRAMPSPGKPSTGNRW